MGGVADDGDDGNAAVTVFALVADGVVLDDTSENGIWCPDDAPSKFQLLTPTLECSASHLNEYLAHYAIYLHRVTE